MAALITAAKNIMKYNARQSSIQKLLNDIRIEAVSFGATLTANPKWDYDDKYTIFKNIHNDLEFGWNQIHHLLKNLQKKFFKDYHIVPDGSKSVF